MSSYLAYRGSDHDQIDPFDVNDSNLWRKAEYLGRYLFAADFLRPYKLGVVADISCGMGYGTLELSGIAGSIIGIDANPSLLQLASQDCRRPNISFLNSNLDCDDPATNIQERSVDAVVSFETLEHLVDPNRAMSFFSRILKPGGFLLCSVPNVLSESGDNAGLPRNKSHKQWFNFASLSRMIQFHGMQVDYRLGQSWSKALFRREQQLLNAKRIRYKLSDEPIMHTSEMIRWLSYVAAYPTVEDVDGSYCIIIVAKKA
jgi:ubiquinone/menaquinone biosynthesis C-methylase UbiE